MQLLSSCVQYECGCMWEVAIEFSVTILLQIVNTCSSDWQMFQEWQLPCKGKVARHCLLTLRNVGWGFVSGQMPDATQASQTHQGSAR